MRLTFADDFGAKEGFLTLIIHGRFAVLNEPFYRTLAMRHLCTAILAAAALSAPLAHADTSKKIADLQVKIAPNLVKKDAGIHTLYVILYDAASTSPMPYGALKVDLPKDATGTFYKVALTTDNVMVMGSSELPKAVKIKVRLDKDGSAGHDEAGDLVGIAAKVATGSKTVITIDKAI